CIDADDAAGAAILRKTHEHAGMGRAGDSADHDVIKGKAELFLLRPHLLGKTDIAEPAIFVHRGARRYRVGLSPTCDHVRDRVLPALADADVKALTDHAHVGAHDAAQQDVADAVVDGIL